MTCRVSIAVILSMCVVSVLHGAEDSTTDTSEPKPLQRFEFLQIRMAIPVRITVYAADEPAANQATRAAYARIKQLDRLLSHYDPDSELSQLCRQAIAGQPVAVGNELALVLTSAERVSRQSDGAFDVTVGPLMDLWRRSRRQRKLPIDSELTTARRLVGFRKVTLDAKTKTVTLQQSGMRLDLGGIAKGYAADEALRVLRKHGITRALIDAGGDLVAGDPPPGSDHWRIGIAPLDSPDAAPTRFLSLSNAAIATSGDASQFVEIDGVRYSHILDPHTGLGLTTHSSVTVIAADGMTADAWASAISVLGADRGITALSHAVPTAVVSVITRDGSGVRTIDSDGFSRYEVTP